jgi:hypothetical protein
MSTATNTSNFNLDKIDKDEQVLDDSVTKLRLIQNGNMDIIDAALQSISTQQTLPYTSVSGAYTALVTDSVIDNGAAVSITLGNIGVGKTLLISNLNTITIFGSGVTVNGIASLSSNAQTIPGAHLHAVQATASTWRIY